MFPLANQKLEVQPVTQLTLPVGERDRLQGAKDAAVTLLEYGDYECPRCGQARPIVKELQERLGERLRFVFRNFPLTTIHAYAQYAAEAAEAASAQGRFWEIHDYLFKYQQALGNGSLLQYAAQLGLDVDRFEREVAEHVYADRVREDFTSGVSSGVNGTPTFFINGVRHDGAWNLEMLLAAIARAMTSSQIKS